MYHDAATVFAKVFTWQWTMWWDVRVPLGSVMALVYTGVVYTVYSLIWAFRLRHFGFAWDGA